MVSTLRKVSSSHFIMYSAVKFLTYEYAWKYRAKQHNEFIKLMEPNYIIKLNTYPVFANGNSF